MQDMVQKLLEELYALDASLRAHEQELKKVLAELLSANPNVTIDPAFAARLRAQLEIRAAELHAVQVATTPRQWFRVPAFAFAGAIVLMLVILPVAITVLQKGARQGTQLAFQTGGITQLSERAFGSLTAQPGGDGKEAGVAASPRPQSGGGGGFGGGRGEMGMGGDAMTSSIAPPYEFTQFVFSYKGESFSVPSEAMVYRKQKDVQTATKLAQTVLGQTPYTGADLGKLSNVYIPQLTLTENRERGYIMNLDFENGSFSLYANWERWPELQNQQWDKPAPSRSDEELIATANAFLAAYGIDRSSYGEPKVVRPFIPMERGVPAWHPQELTVVYPLIVDNQTVYDQGGAINGISANINLATNIVTSLYNLETVRFERSVYPAETDAARIISVAERGGVHGGYGVTDANVKTITVELQTPFLALVRTWHYDEKTRRGQELLIPSYIFPIMKPADSQLYQDYVVVPVAKELLDNQQPPVRILPVEPMPMPLDAPAIEPKG